MLNGVIVRALIALATANLAFPENKLALGRANAAGSEARVGAATVAYIIFDPDSRSLRLITGKIGAALLRSPLELEVKLSYAAVSPRQDYALGIAADSGEVFLLPFEGGISAARAIGSVADQLALSPGGRSAVLYSATSRSLTVITGLPGATRIASTLDMMNLPGSVSALAVSDEGSSVLVAVRAEHGSDMYLAAGSGVEHLGPAGDIASIQFLHDRPDALIVDRKEKRLYRLIGRGLHDIAAESITDPIAVGVLPGNRRAFIANADSSDVVSLNLDTGQTSALSCECKPQRMSPLGPRSLFQLSDPGSGTLWVLDASANEPRLAFVPPEFRSGGSER
jgi:hypothetical protein